MPRWFWCLEAVICYFTMYRNLRTYRMRKRMLHQISVLNLRDINHGIFETMPWRWTSFTSVSFVRILLSPLKPFRPSSYWKDTRFLMDDVSEVPVR